MLQNGYGLDPLATLGTALSRSGPSTLVAGRTRWEDETTAEGVLVVKVKRSTRQWRRTPAPTISGTGLPSWLTLTADHNGTATLSATKPVKGKYSFTLTATNTKGSVNQTFSLTVTKG